MKVLVDTSVWSIALQHSVPVTDADEIKEQLSGLIDDVRVAMIGPVRQELLSGVKSKSQFNLLKKRLDPFRVNSYKQFIPILISVNYLRS